jgi:uncharacterized small protein (DUF1192 family)
MPLDTRIILDASEALNALAKAYKKAGKRKHADRLFQFAADLEIASPELQNCWGGPLNGQVGRQAIMLDLLRLVGPVAIIETGTFRGISVDWFARYYPGPVLSCEKEPMYYLQAKARVSQYSNVDLRREDSRIFLREVLGTLPTDKPILLYLDDHWGFDLPLREEMAIIFATHHRSVVVIDDFRVPDDAGYGWDDYGPRGSLDLNQLDGVIPADARLFFPVLRSNNETGARRGCCVIAAEAAAIVARSALLRGDTIESWKEVERNAPKSTSQNQESSGKEPGPALDKMSYSQLRNLIEMLSERLAEVNHDRAVRLEAIGTLTAEIHRLHAHLAEVERDRALRLEGINTLTAEIHRLHAHLAEVERDRALRLEAIGTLTAEIHRLHAHLAKVDRDRAAPPQGDEDPDGEES